MNLAARTGYNMTPFQNWSSVRRSCRMTSRASHPSDSHFTPFIILSFTWRRLPLFEVSEKEWQVAHEERTRNRGMDVDNARNDENGYVS